MPFADTVTIARVVGDLEAKWKKVLIRRESASTFSDLREGPVVLIGAFNNEWSLRLTHQLRYSLALDSEKHLIYIKDVKNPSSRSWSWRTDQSTNHHVGPGSPVFKDYALISRIRNSETGHVVVVIGGLYHLRHASRRRVPHRSAAHPGNRPKATRSDSAHQNLQIVLGNHRDRRDPGAAKGRCRLGRVADSPANPNSIKISNISPIPDRHGRYLSIYLRLCLYTTSAISRADFRRNETETKSGGQRQVMTVRNGGQAFCGAFRKLWRPL